MGLDTVGLDTMGDMEGELDGDDVVGALVRAAAAAPASARRGRRGPLWLRGVSRQGVSEPSQELDFLPFVTTVLTSANATGNATAFPQRPFRGERIIMTATYVPAVGTPFDVSNSTIITPAIYVGAVQIGASQGDTPMSAFAPTAFGVRLSFSSSGQGTRIFIPYAATIPIAVGDKIQVNATAIGRAVR